MINNVLVNLPCHSIARILTMLLALFPPSCRAPQFCTRHLKSLETLAFVTHNAIKVVTTAVFTITKEYFK